MRNVALLMGCLSLAMPAASASELVLFASAGISSETARAGDQLEFVLASQALWNGVVVPAGSRAFATVTAARPASNLARAGELEMDWHGLCLGEGRLARLRGTPVAGARVELTTPRGAGWELLPALPFTMFQKGAPMNLAKGTAAGAYLDADAPVEDDVRCAAAGQATAPKQAVLAVHSTPAGREILIDGVHAGHTPLLVRLAPGEHLVSVRGNGPDERARVWQRAIRLQPGEELRAAVNLNVEPARAALEQRPPAASGAAVYSASSAKPNGR